MEKKHGKENERETETGNDCVTIKGAGLSPFNTTLDDLVFFVFF